MDFTDTKTFTARKAHICCWCGTSISPGEMYRRYTMFDSGTATALRFHFECYSSMIEDIAETDGEFLLHANNRGCNCYRSANCERCYPKAMEGIKVTVTSTKSMPVRELDAISEHFDPDNETLLSHAIYGAGRAKLDALRDNNLDSAWPEVIATVYPADGDGIVVNAMFVPLACLREVGAVLLRYADDIDRMTAQFRQEGGQRLNDSSARREGE